MLWSDGGYALSRGEKATTCEGALRVSCMIDWRGHISACREAPGIQSHEDRFVTLAAAAGLTNLKEVSPNGYKASDTGYSGAARSQHAQHEKVDAALKRFGSLWGSN
jgi:arylsulfatase